MHFFAEELVGEECLVEAARCGAAEVAIDEWEGAVAREAFECE